MENYLFKFKYTSTHDSKERFVCVLHSIKNDDNIRTFFKNNTNLNFSITGRTIKKNIKIGTNSIDYIPIFLEDWKHVIKLANPIFLNSDNLSEADIMKKTTEEIAAISDKHIIFLNKESLNWNYFQKSGVKYFNTAQKDLDLSYTYFNAAIIADTNIMKAFKELVNLPEEECNKPRSIDETIEVFNPDVDGIKHVNLVRHKMTFNF